MEYCSNLKFEEAADFEMLKILILQAAKENEINLFDNVFDWSLQLTSKAIQSNPYRYKASPIGSVDGPAMIGSSNNMQQKNEFENECQKDERYDRARNFRFNSYSDIKLIIY
jgi:hypothetical protein